MEKGITILMMEALKKIPYEKRWSEIDGDLTFKEIVSKSISVKGDTLVRPSKSNNIAWIRLEINSNQ